MNKNIIGIILDKIGNDEIILKTFYTMNPEIISKYFIKKYMNDNVIDFYYDHQHLINNYEKQINEHKEQIDEKNIDKSEDKNLLKNLSGRDKCNRCGDRLYEARRCYICYRLFCNEYSRFNCGGDSCSPDHSRFYSPEEYYNAKNTLCYCERYLCSVECITEFINQKCIKCKSCSLYCEFCDAPFCEICSERYCLDCLSDSKKIICEKCLETYSSSDSDNSNISTQSA